MASRFDVVPLKHENFILLIDFRFEGLNTMGKRCKERRERVLLRRKMLRKCQFD